MWRWRAAVAWLLIDSARYHTEACQATLLAHGIHIQTLSLQT